MIVAAPQSAHAQSSANASPIIEAAPETEPRVCHQTYHSALAAIRSGDLPKLRVALDSLGKPDPAVASKWSFWPRTVKRKRRRRVKNGMIRPMLLDGRVCIDEIQTRSGRSRCRKWVKATPERIAAYTIRLRPSDPRPNRRERRDLNLINDTVLNQGKLTAFSEGGRFYFVVRKIVDDLTGYLDQPLNPGLCNGVSAMLAFYRTRLEPLEKRIAQLDALIRRSETRAIGAAKRLDRQMTAAAKTRRAAEGETTARLDAVAPAESGVRDALAAGELPQAGAALTRVVVALVEDRRLRLAAAAARASDVATDAAPPRAPAPAQLAQVSALPDTTAFLEGARELVDEAATRAGGRNPARTAIVGLRALETLRNARQTRQIYARFQTAVAEMLATIRSAHRRSCRC
ncbi:MAG: hypothetical protein AAFQ45_04435 [Pseudomonadota bacterium]